MRHLKHGRKLGRTTEHKRAMIRNLSTSLFVHGRVVTTPEKAKETRPFAEKLITLAKVDTLHHRRRAIQLLHDEKVVAALFSELGPRYQQRPGGYTRILRLAKPRVGDAAKRCLFELVEAELPNRAKKTKAAVVADAPAAPAAEAEAEAPTAPSEEAPAPTAEAPAPEEAPATEEAPKAE